MLSGLGDEYNCSTFIFDHVCPSFCPSNNEVIANESEIFNHIIIFHLQVSTWRCHGPGRQARTLGLCCGTARLERGRG